MMSTYEEEMGKRRRTYDTVREIKLQLTSAVNKEPGLKSSGVTTMNRIIGQLQELEDHWAPEKVEVLAQPDEEGAPPLGHVMLGGISIGLTRSYNDGSLRAFVENTGDAPTFLSIELLDGVNLWAGNID